MFIIRECELRRAELDIQPSSVHVFWCDSNVPRHIYFISMNLQGEGFNLHRVVFIPNPRAGIRCGRENISEFRLHSQRGKNQFKCNFWRSHRPVHGHFITRRAINSESKCGA